MKEEYRLLLAERDLERQKLIIKKINLKSKNQIASLDLLVSSIESKERENFQGFTTEKIILIFANILLIAVLFVIWRLFLWQNL